MRRRLPLCLSDRKIIYRQTLPCGFLARNKTNKKTLKRRLDDLSKEMDAVSAACFPSLPDGQSGNKKGKGHPKRLHPSLEGRRHVEYKSLREMIEELSLLHIRQPQNPYKDITTDYWSQYVTILVQCGIAMFKPSDSNQIQLTPFHKTL
eukprot:m.15364 g.15364  ORF g.15364 m.15364 type:complete len:149 (+) comp26327_c0_seq2:503-949(+)